jgi:hypothetical protein
MAFGLGAVYIPTRNSTLLQYVLISTVVISGSIAWIKVHVTESRVGVSHQGNECSPSRQIGGAEEQKSHVCSTRKLLGL